MLYVNYVVFSPEQFSLLEIKISNPLNPEQQARTERCR